MASTRLRLMLLLIGGLINSVSGGFKKSRALHSWTLLNSDVGSTPVKTNGDNLVTVDFEEVSPSDGQDYFLGRETNETNEGDREFIFPQQYLNFQSKKIYQDKTRNRGQMSMNTKFPIELESFVGDVLDEKLNPISFGEKSTFQKWLREMNRETRKVEQLMKVEKRNHHAVQENNQNNLWSCETEYGWRNLGKDHYPQFIRTATCTTPNCFSELYRCVPRRYTLKVLKKLEPDEVIDNSAAVKLPEALRSSVKFINVTTNICCECASA